MKKDFIRKDLYAYINSNIKSKYKSFDKAHNISHYNFVTNNCLEYGNELINQGYDVDLEIAYVVGAYHDIGISLWNCVIYDGSTFHRNNFVLRQNTVSRLMGCGRYTSTTCTQKMRQANYRQHLIAGPFIIKLYSLFF